MTFPVTWPKSSESSSLPSCRNGPIELFSTENLPHLSHRDRFMPKGNVYRERTSAQFAIGAISFIVVGIALIRASEWADLWPNWKPVLANIGGLLVASVGVGVLWELVGRRTFVEEIFEAASVSSEVQSAKIS